MTARTVVHVATRSSSIEKLWGQLLRTTEAHRPAKKGTTGLRRSTDYLLRYMWKLLHWNVERNLLLLSSINTPSTSINSAESLIFFIFLASTTLLDTRSLWFVSRRTTPPTVWKPVLQGHILSCLQCFKQQRLLQLAFWPKQTAAFLMGPWGSREAMSPALQNSRDCPILRTHTQLTNPARFPVCQRHQRKRGEVGTKTGFGFRSDVYVSGYWLLQVF